MVRTLWLLVLGGLMMNFNVLSSSASEVKRVESKTFKMTPGGHIAVEGEEGFIKVNSWDKPEVNLVMTKRAWGRSEKDAENLLERIEVRISESENHLDIKLVKPRETQTVSFWDLFDPDTWGKYRHGISVDFEITVPKQINVNLINDEGDVTIQSIQGDVEIRVDEGDIELNDIDFEVMNLYANEGDIDGARLNNPRGRIVVKLDEGDVTFEEIESQRLSIQCDEGDVTIKKLTCLSCDISADEGDVVLAISPQEADRYRISADEGNIVFYLPQSPDVDLDLETRDGDIRSEFDVRILRRDDRQRCQDKIGEGKSYLEASADEGTIFLRKDQ